MEGAAEDTTTLRGRKGTKAKKWVGRWVDGGKAPDVLVVDEKKRYAWRKGCRCRAAPPTFERCCPLASQKSDACVLRAPARCPEISLPSLLEEREEREDDRPTLSSSAFKGIGEEGGYWL